MPLRSHCTITFWNVPNSLLSLITEPRRNRVNHLCAQWLQLDRHVAADHRICTLATSFAVPRLTTGSALLLVVMLRTSPRARCLESSHGH